MSDIWDSTSSQPKTLQLGKATLRLVVSFRGLLREQNTYFLIFGFLLVIQHKSIADILFVLHLVPCLGFQVYPTDKIYTEAIFKNNPDMGSLATAAGMFSLANFGDVCSLHYSL